LTKKQLIEQVRLMAKKLGRTPTRAEFAGKTPGAHYSIPKEAGDYAKLLKAAGLSTHRERVASDMVSRAGHPKDLQESLKIKTLKDDVSRLTARLEEAEKEAMTSQAIQRLVGSLGAFSMSDAPEWVQGPRHRTKATHGIPTVLISDVHFDEVVRPEQIQGLNEYNREIARKRIIHTFKTTIMLLKDCFVSPKYDGIVCALNGDMLSGIIHEELRETNEEPIARSIFELANLLRDGIGMLADEFGKVFVPCEVGNHGRMDKKPRAKNKVYDNFEFIIYQILARDFKNDDRVTFLIPDGPTLQYQLYNTSYLMEHGDAYKGGSGIAGVLSPLLLGMHRKHKKQAAMKKPFDYMIMGHWHQYIHLESGLIINGSIKGPDEWTMGMNFTPERPAQAMWITHPDNGITFRAPIICDSYLTEKKAKTKDNTKALQIIW
jgi:hypothetical protein